MKWEYEDKRPQGFERWFAKYKQAYEIDVCKIGENRYSVRWYHKGLTIIKEYIDANSLAEAKALAIGIVSNYFHQMADYWKDLEISFVNWVEEE